MQTDAWIIEFGLGKREPIITIGLHVRGGTEPKEVFACLVHECGMQLLEWSTGEFLDLSKQSSFQEWQQWRERALPKD